MILVCNMRTLHSRKHYYLPSTGGRIFHFCSVELTTVAEPHSGSVGGPSSVPQAVGQQRQSDAPHKPLESRAVCRDASVVLFPRRACPQDDFAMSESIASQPASQTALSDAFCRSISAYFQTIDTSRGHEAGNTTRHSLGQLNAVRLRAKIHLWRLPVRFGTWVSSKLVVSVQ